mmetsp:Transcript_44121/g.112617  ORF Transcript_44121/g.112617 Transcript_44121/m.112617 type:complete len:112 (+) Transcript_44121:138-473(+)
MPRTRDQGGMHIAGSAPAQQQANPLRSFAIGSLAACGAVTLTNPFDVIKTRLVLQGQKHARALFTDPVHALRMILANEGPSALLKGLVPAYATQVICLYHDVVCLVSLYGV